MPRTSRTVAQRLAAQGKSRRRRSTRGGEALAPRVQQILDEVAPEPAETSATEPVVAAAVEAARPAALGATPRGGSSRAATARRPYADYGTEYSYVWADLRRIALVAGGLLALLIVLAFFIR